MHVEKLQQRGAGHSCGRQGSAGVVDWGCAGSLLGVWSTDFSSKAVEAVATRPHTREPGGASAAGTSSSGIGSSSAPWYTGRSSCNGCTPLQSRPNSAAPGTKSAGLSGRRGASGRISSGRSGGGISPRVGSTSSGGGSSFAEAGTKGTRFSCAGLSGGSACMVRPGGSEPVWRGFATAVQLHLNPCCLHGGSLNNSMVLQ